VLQEHRSWLQLQIVLLICRFTPKCPEVARLLSLQMEQPLPLNTRIKLRVHFLMCSFCERYKKHLEYIRTVSREFPNKVGEASDAKLPSDVKERMREALRP